MKGNKTVLISKQAPQAIGPYSQGIASGSMVFVSGQIPLDPSTGTLIPGGIKEQTAQALKNVGAVLHAAKITYKDVIKATVYMTNLSEFTDMNEVYQKFFSTPFPARAVVQVAALPKGAAVEIEVIGVSSGKRGEVVL